MFRRLYERIRAQLPPMPSVLWLVAIPAAILPVAWFQVLHSTGLPRISLSVDVGLCALLVAAEAALALLVETYRRQQRDAARFNAFTRKVLAILDTRDLTHTITREAGTLVDADGVEIVLVADGDVLVVSPASTGVFASAAGQPVPTEGSLSGWCVRTGDATIANRVQRDPRAFKGAFGVDAEHVIAAPLEVGGVRFGAILAARGGLDARPFNEGHLHIWVRVAQTVAPALSNARLYKRALLRRQHLEELHTYAATLVGTLDLQQVFDGVTERAARMVGTDAASFVLSDGAEIVYESRFGQEAFAPGFRLLAEDSLAGTVVSENRAVRVSDTTMDTRYNLHGLKTKTQAVLAVPVRIDGVARGSLGVLQYAARQFTDEEEEVLQQFADVAASVVRAAQAFDAVDRSHKRFLSLFRAMPEGALLIRRDGVIELANPAAEQLFRVSAGGLTDAALATFAPDAPALQDWLFNWERNGTPRRGELERCDREVRKVEWRANRFAGDDDRVICAVRDLTDELKQTAEMRTLAAAVHAMRDGVALVEPGGAIRFVNKAAATILGYDTAAEIVGQQVSMLMPESQIAALAPLLLTSRAEGWAGEGVALHSSGRPVPVQLAIAPIREDARTVGLVGVFVDLTERRSLEQRAAVSEKLATLGRLVAGAAHEINNPLTAVLAEAQLALLEIPDGHAARESLTIVATEARRAGQIVKSMLSFARQRPVEQRDFELRTVLDEVVRLRRSYWQSLGIDAVIEGEPAHVRGDADQLKQVLLNLVVNAEYALRGAAERRLHLVASRRGRTCRITIDDSGPGVPESQRGQIFEPFFTTKPEGEGSGLGLSVSYGIVHEHGGEIWIETSPEGGARFVIELPAGAAPRSSGAHGMPAPVEPPTAALHRRVLLVDDEEPIRSVAQRILRRHGHEVDVAADGSAALRLLEATRYDVVLCDIRMPNGSGPELYDELRRRGIAQRSRFVVTTGDVADPDTQRFLGESGLPVLLKPFELRALLEVVASD